MSAWNLIPDSTVDPARLWRNWIEELLIPDSIPFCGIDSELNSFSKNRNWNLNSKQFLNSNSNSFWHYIFWIISTNLSQISLEFMKLLKFSLKVLKVPQNIQKLAHYWNSHFMEQQHHACKAKCLMFFLKSKILGGIGIGIGIDKFLFQNWNLIRNWSLFWAKELIRNWIPFFSEL